MLIRFVSDDSVSKSGFEIQTKCNGLVVPNDINAPFPEPGIDVRPVTVPASPSFNVPASPIGPPGWSPPDPVEYSINDYTCVNSRWVVAQFGGQFKCVQRMVKIDRSTDKLFTLAEAKHYCQNDGQYIPVPQSVDESADLRRIMDGYDDKGQSFSLRQLITYKSQLILDIYFFRNVLDRG